MNKQHSIDVTGTEFDQFNREHRHEAEERIWIAIAADRVYEEKPGLGNEAPEFANGKKAFAVKMRETVARRLHKRLGECLKEIDNEE